jgi:hypothetical protein
MSTLISLPLDKNSLGLVKSLIWILPAPADKNAWSNTAVSADIPAGTEGINLVWRTIRVPGAFTGIVNAVNNQPEPGRDDSNFPMARRYSRCKYSVDELGDFIL